VLRLHLSSLSVKMCFITDVIDQKRYTTVPVQAVLWHRMSAMGLALFQAFLNLSFVNLFSSLCAVAEDSAWLP